MDDDTSHARFRHGANLIVRALLDLQEEHGLTDLEMISVLSEHQRSLLSEMMRGADS